MPSSHAVTLALVIWARSNSSSMPLLSWACLLNNSKWCMPSYVSPSSYTVLLLWCFLLITMGGHTFKRKQLQSKQLHSKRGGRILGRLQYSHFVILSILTKWEGDKVGNWQSGNGITPFERTHFRLHQLVCGDREMGTASSHVLKKNQPAGLIHMVGSSISKVVSLR